jgi:hypothetical protein
MIFGNTHLEVKVPPTRNAHRRTNFASSL